MVEVAESEPTFWRAKLFALIFAVHGVWLDVEMHVPPIAKQPPERFTPRKVEVAPLTTRLFPTFKLVVVALVPVAEVNVSVEKKPLVAEMPVVVACPMMLFVFVNVVAKRLVEVAEVLVLFVDCTFVSCALVPVSVPATFKFVVVALVPVAFVQVKVEKKARVAERSVEVAAVARRFEMSALVLVNVVAKRLVEVALVDVALPTERN